MIVDSEKGVEDTLDSGMISKCKGSDTACFAYDQVKDAAKLLLPKNPKRIYLCATRSLHKLLSEDNFKEHIDTVASLYDKAKDKIDDNEHIDVAKFFHFAHEKAMNSIAACEAFEYFKSSFELLHDNAWETHYELTISAHCSARKSAYWLTNYKYIVKYIDIVFKSAKTPLEWIKSSQ